MRGPMLVPEFGGIGQSFTPGKCFMCGTSAAGRGVLCTGVDITNRVETNRYGKVQFCGECVKAMGFLFGLTPSDVHDRLMAKALEHAEAVKHLKSVQAKLEVALKTVQAIVAK